MFNSRNLNFDNILHYQKIIVALSETDRLMKAVDGVLGENFNSKMNNEINKNDKKNISEPSSDIN